MTKKKLRRYDLDWVDEEVGMITIDCSYGAHCNADEAEEIIDALTIENKKLKEAISLYGPPDCDHLHHPKKYYHEGSGRCPIMDKIEELTETTH